MTTLPFFLLALSPFLIFDSDHALHSTLNTLQNIWMMLGRNAEQDKTTHHIQVTTLAFFVLESSPFVLFFKLISCQLCNSNTFQNILIVFGRNVEQYEMKCRVKELQLPFLLLALSPFIIFDSDYALVLCLLCKSNTLWNILMILGSNEEQDQMTCHIPESAAKRKLENGLRLSIRLSFRNTFLSAPYLLNPLKDFH